MRDATSRTVTVSLRTRDPDRARVLGARLNGLALQAREQVRIGAMSIRHGQRLRKRCGKVRGDLSTFLIHPDVPPDNDGSERQLRPTATCRQVAGGLRSEWNADLFAGVRSVVSTAAGNGIDAYAVIRNTLHGCSVPAAGRAVTDGQQVQGPCGPLRTRRANLCRSEQLPIGHRTD